MTSVLRLFPARSAQRCKRHAKKSPRLMHVHDPLTRPAPADENAGAVHPLPQGGEGGNRENGSVGFIPRLRDYSWVAPSGQTVCHYSQ